MEEIISRLEEIPNSYEAFIEGVTAYIKDNLDRQNRVLNFLNSSASLTTSDVVKYISDQPDFYEDSAKHIDDVGANLNLGQMAHRKLGHFQ